MGWVMKSQAKPRNLGEEGRAERLGEAVLSGRLTVLPQTTRKLKSEDGYWTSATKTMWNVGSWVASVAETSTGYNVAGTRIDNYVATLQKDTIDTTIPISAKERQELGIQRADPNILDVLTSYYRANRDQLSPFQKDAIIGAIQAYYNVKNAGIAYASDIRNSLEKFTDPFPRDKWEVLKEPQKIVEEERVPSAVLDAPPEEVKLKELTTGEALEVALENAQEHMKEELNKSSVRPNAEKEVYNPGGFSALRLARLKDDFQSTLKRAPLDTNRMMIILMSMYTDGIESFTGHIKSCIEDVDLNIDPATRKRFLESLEEYEPSMPDLEPRKKGDTPYGQAKQQWTEREKSAGEAKKSDREPGGRDK